MGAFDDIIQKYGNPQGSVPAAQARFSRAPIYSVDLRDFQSLKQADPSGQYYPRARAIRLNVTPNATYEQMQGVVRHEDAHAILNSVGQLGAELPPALHTIPRNLLDMFRNLAPTTLDLSWGASNRAGEFNTEIPAYMTAYAPGQITGITPEMAQSWLKAYSDTLPDDAKGKILRLGDISRSATRQMTEDPKR